MFLFFCLLTAEERQWGVAICRVSKCVGCGGRLRHRLESPDCEIVLVVRVGESGFDGSQWPLCTTLLTDCINLFWILSSAKRSGQHQHGHSTRRTRQGCAPVISHEKTSTLPCLGTVLRTHASAIALALWKRRLLAAAAAPAGPSLADHATAFDPTRWERPWTTPTSCSTWRRAVRCLQRDEPRRDLRVRRLLQEKAPEWSMARFNVHWRCCSRPTTFFSRRVLFVAQNHLTFRRRCEERQQTQRAGQHRHGHSTRLARLGCALVLSPSDKTSTPPNLGIRAENTCRCHHWPLVFRIFLSRRRARASVGCALSCSLE